jgi:hypothetical protein
MKSVYDERERIPFPIREAHDYDAVQALEADHVALGRPRTKYRLVSGKAQAPLQDRSSGSQLWRSSRVWERYGAELPGRRGGRRGSATPPRTQPISTQLRRELTEDQLWPISGG